MRIEFCRRQTCVTQEALSVPNVHSGLDQLRSSRVPEHMWCHTLCQSGIIRGSPESSPNGGRRNRRPSTVE
jgi:hypothetical protein